MKTQIRLFRLLSTGFVFFVTLGIPPPVHANTSPLGTEERTGTMGKLILIVAEDPLKFSVKLIEARPGEKIHVQLRNDDPMPKEVMGHNWILLKAGKDPAVYAAGAMAAKSEDFQPKALGDQVLAAIHLLGPKESGDVTFDAPTAPGNYYFLCSFPGHQAAGMSGTLTVK